MKTKRPRLPHAIFKKYKVRGLTLLISRSVLKLSQLRQCDIGEGTNTEDQQNRIKSPEIDSHTYKS